MSDERAQKNLSSYSLSFDPMIIADPHQFVSDPGPRKANDREGIYEHIPHLFVNCDQFFLFLFAFQSTSLYIDLKMTLSLKCSLWICHKILNLLEKVQHCNSWEYFSLELRRHPVESIHTLKVIVSRIPIFPTQRMEKT